jgi:putative DNA primase/helicase
MSNDVTVNWSSGGRYWKLSGSMLQTEASGRSGRILRIASASSGELVLSLSGGDDPEIRIMRQDQFTGANTLRIVFATNELADIPDPAGAFAARLKVINLTKSWSGKEDTELTSRLLGELPGLFNRVMGAYQRARVRKGFIQPKSGVAMLNAQKAKSDPSLEFLQNFCVLNPEASIEKTALYNAYRRWASATGLARPYQPNTFPRDFLSKFGISATRPRVHADDLVDEGKRAHVYCGIDLAPGWQEMLDELEGTPF